MNRIFKCKTRGTKVYQCHKYKLRHCFELDTILEQKSWVLRIYKVGPAYLKEGNRPNYQVKRKAVFLQKQDFFFPESPNVNQNISWKQFSFYSLDILDTRYQRGPGKVTLLPRFPSFCFLDVSPITLSNTGKHQILTNLSFIIL